MSTITHDGLSVCSDCAQILANGEIDDGTDRGEQVAAAIGERWADYELVLACPEDCEGGFSSRQCDGCGDILAGDRHPAVAFAAQPTNHGDAARRLIGERE